MSFNDPSADGRDAHEPTFPAPPARSNEDVDLESWEWPGEQQHRSPAETLQGEEVPASEEGLYPLAGETPDYRLADAPPADDGYTVPDRLAAPKPPAGRRLVHWGLAIVMLGGLVLGGRMVWNRIAEAFAEFESHIAGIREEGNQNPQHRKLVEERLNDPTRRSPGTSRKDESDGPGAGSSPARTSNGRKNTATMLADLLKGRKKAADTGAGKHAPPKSAPIEAETSTRSRGGYTLQAIVNGPGGNLAMINGKCVREGQRVDGAVLKKVTSASVTLEKDGRRLVLKW
jgi:hypothetical protein